MTPKVTVLMPVYNGTLYLREAIDSILAQTFEDFELLIVDDASTDESASIIRSYDDTRIRLVTNDVNLGQVRSQNKGLRLARGEYVARLDQDDKALPHRFERQIAILDSQPTVAVVGTWLYELDGAGCVTDVWRGCVADRADYLFAILTDSLPLYHPSVMFRRDAVMQLHGYDERVQYCEDQDLWRRLALSGYGARVIPMPLICYRVHGGQQTVSRSETQAKNHILSQERFIQAFTDEFSARPLRLLMTCRRSKGDDFWDICQSPALAKEWCRQLASMLGQMRLRLQLQPSQYRKLEHSVRCQAARAASRAWRRGVGRQWFASPPIYVFSLLWGIAMASSFHVWMYPLVYVVAPMLPVLRGLKRLALRSRNIRRWGNLFSQRARLSNAMRVLHRITR